MATRRTQTPDSRDLSRVQWVTVNARSGPQHRYRDTATGRYISARQVKADVARMADLAGRDVARQLTTALRDGRISLAEWQTGMARAVKNVNYAAVAAASGGVNNMTAVERGRAGAIIKEQYKRLRGFAQDIASGKQKLDGRALRRAEMYMDAAKGSFHEQKRAGFADSHAGAVVMVRSIRHKRDSCRSCIGLDHKWFKSGDPEYIPVGHRECNVNCGCTEELGTLADDGTIAGQGLEGF
jgi:hypothetical protein